MLNKRIVFLGRALGEGLEPVGVVGNTVLACPLYHAGRYTVGHGTVEAGTVVDDVHHLLVDVLRQVFIHLFAVEDLLAEIFAGSFDRTLHFEGLFLECLSYHLKSEFVSHNCDD